MKAVVVCSALAQVVALNVSSENATELELSNISPQADTALKEDFDDVAVLEDEIQTVKNARQPSCLSCFVPRRYIAFYNIQFYFNFLKV